MAKQKEENLGTFIKKHPSGMLETDKGEKSFQGNIGEVFMRGVDGKTYIKSKTSKNETVEETVDVADADVLTGTGEAQ
jgi:hypothetical protein